MTALLEVSGLSRHFGRLPAVDDVTLRVEAGEIRGLVGPNGAGKTTLFHLLTGFLQPTAGQVRFGGRDITRVPAAQRVGYGLARTFQTPQICPEMTTVENVLLATQARRRAGGLSAVLGLRAFTRERSAFAAEADELLEFLGISQWRDVQAKNLPYGPLRLLEIARALMARPRLLLLDEPAAGMNHREVEALDDLIRQINRRGITVVLVEHNMRLVMGICAQVTVLDFGRVIAAGTPLQVRTDPRVIESYLGASV